MKLKSGIIPYYNNSETQEVNFLFMVSSDASYGGGDPAIAKGRMNVGEQLLQAAVREGEEELGLKQSNFASPPKLLGTYEITGLLSTYNMQIYIVNIKDPEDFARPHYETEKTVWMTAREFRQHGRRTHMDIVMDAARKAH